MYKFTDIENSEIPTGESKMRNSGGCYVKTATGLNSSCNSLPACFLSSADFFKIKLFTKNS